MPKTVINVDTWDDYVRELRRTGHERIVAVHVIGDGTRYSVLTEPIFMDQFHSPEARS
jgi:hypothetical protein